MHRHHSIIAFSLREKRLVFEMNQNASPETAPVVPEAEEKAENVSSQKDAAQAEGKRVDQADVAVRAAEAKANRPVAGLKGVAPGSIEAALRGGGIKAAIENAGQKTDTADTRKPSTILPQGIENKLIDVRAPDALQSIDGKMKQFVKNPSAFMSSAGGYSKYGSPENYPGGQSIEGFTAWLKDKGHPEAAEAEALSAALTPDERDVLNFIIAHPDSIPNVAAEKPVKPNAEMPTNNQREKNADAVPTGNEKPEFSVEQQRQFADDLLGIIRDMSAQLGPDAPVVPVTWDEMITDPATKDYFLTSLAALQKDTGRSVSVPGVMSAGQQFAPENQESLPKNREAIARQFIKNAKDLLPEGVTVKPGEKETQVIVEQNGLSMTIIPQSNGEWVAVTEPGKAITIDESKFTVYEGNLTLGQEQMLQMIGRGLQKAREEKILPAKS